VSSVADARVHFNDEDPWLCSFAGVEARRPFLEEGSKRITSIRRALIFRIFWTILPERSDSPQKQMIDALRVLDKPLVGAVRGAAIGSGATMLTYFDFV
jgi:hypothetical protein